MNRCVEIESPVDVFHQVGEAPDGGTVQFNADGVGIRWSHFHSGNGWVFEHRYYALMTISSMRSRSSLASLTALSVMFLLFP